MSNLQSLSETIECIKVDVCTALVGRLTAITKIQSLIKACRSTYSFSGFVATCSQPVILCAFFDKSILQAYRHGRARAHNGFSVACMGTHAAYVRPLHQGLTCFVSKDTPTDIIVLQEVMRRRPFSDAFQAAVGRLAPVFDSALSAEQGARSKFMETFGKGLPDWPAFVSLCEPVPSPGAILRPRPFDALLPPLSPGQSLPLIFYQK